MEDFRLKGKKALKTVLKNDKNITILEEHIFKYNESKENYFENIYQIIADIKKEKDFKIILCNIKNKKLGWNHSIFNKIQASIIEQNDFIKNPFEVEEGVFQCKQCGSKRVYSYAKQDRSCDEGTSVYAQCVACKAKWRERG